MTFPISLRVFVCVWFALAAGSASAAYASDAGTAKAPAGATPPAALADAPNAPVPLATLGNLPGPMRLSGEAGSGALSVPVSAREQVRSATLHLVATNSVALLNARSALAVRVNDRTIAQMQLSPRQPELTADIRIPADLLRAGYNTLAFSVAQHSTENCEDPDSPELWTEIDTSASTLQVQTELKPLAPMLSDLDGLIDPKEAHAGSIAIVAAAHPKSDLQLESGALLAEGVALRLRYLVAHPKVQDAHQGAGGGVLPGMALGSLAGADVLLFGTRDALRPYLDPRVAAHIGGAFLGIYPKPDDPRHFVLVVSGADDAQVALAARAFAHAELPQPRRNEMTVNAFDEARIGRYAAHGVVSGTQPHSFKELGFTSRTLGAADRIELGVTLPADIYAPEDAQVMLDLNFTEGAKMRQDSVLGIYLNNRFEQVIALDQQQGAVLRHYRVSIPLRSFRPGANVLSLRPILVPLVSDHCMLRETRNLQLTVFDDSSLKLPPASHFTTLPDLQRFAQSVFPYAVKPDGADLALQVAARDNDTLAAAWTLMGKLAQKQGWPLTAAQVTAGGVEPGRQEILVGGAGGLSHAAWSGAPWEPGRVMTVAYDPGAQAAAAGGRDDAGLWQSLRTRFGGSERDGAPPSESMLSADTTLSRQLLVMQYRGSAGNTVTLFTAANPAELAEGVGRMVEPNDWDNLGGDVSLVSFDRPDVWTGRSGASYDFGGLSAYDRLGYELSSHPWWGYAALVGLLALLAALTAVLLRRRYRKHHAGSQD
ncbi:cellulose biosynthesis cyclic di-GMP-binding regulatory protein BcsB [Trinickia terrae]|uniref:Cyclic di-GMP-binding protein n=1 Tax=Trinickia terrae TaxID=2571161 RepID=A0A4U1HDY3_9BURK|nr:cellulose biosynthesis cyclic di-GMP-binding regulatory protein BcsB [Trinickia terrae]TKC78083.1 cellulose biosynthesis cyclic di-GMP-binding regulatory protein BcsB [Trinickia terrae]